MIPFVTGAILFCASFLLCMQCAERSGERGLGRFVNAERDRWGRLTLLCAFGVGIGMFLMLIGPRIF